MTVKNFKDYFESEYGWTEAISIGKIDADKDIAICFYDNKSDLQKIGTVGGRSNCSYAIKLITVLLRYGKNANTAEIQANNIFNFFDEKDFCVDGKKVFVISRYQFPVSLGTDDNGVYEYTMNFEIYYQK